MPRATVVGIPLVTMIASKRLEANVRQYDEPHHGDGYGNAGCSSCSVLSERSVAIRRCATGWRLGSCVTANGSELLLGQRI